MAVAPGIEFMQWYGTNQQMVRCGGDGGCGALVMSGDAELHLKFHSDLLAAFTSALGVLAKLAGVEP